MLLLVCWVGNSARGAAELLAIEIMELVTASQMSIIMLPSFSKWSEKFSNYFFQLFPFFCIMSSHRQLVSMPTAQISAPISSSSISLASDNQVPCKKKQLYRWDETSQEMKTICQQSFLYFQLVFLSRFARKYPLIRSLLCAILLTKTISHKSHFAAMFQDWYLLSDNW